MEDEDDNDGEDQNLNDQLNQEPMESLQTISLQALIGIPHFQTMKVARKFQKQLVHILINEESEEFRV